MEIQHMSHEHTLTLCMLSDQEADDHKAPQRCEICRSDIHGQAFTCTERCNFWVHPPCVDELPTEIVKHPFHSAHSPCLHSLRLQNVFFLFLCDGCQEYCHGISYFCRWCNFRLGTECACLTCKEAEASKGVQTKTTISHFSHHHQLTRCTVRQELPIACSACKERLFGASYVCERCSFYLHESCLDDIVQEVEHPFHPQHRLLALGIVDDDDNNVSERCNACCGKVKGISFSCEDCNFYLHISCARYETRAIKHEYHEHNLFYFGPRNIGRHGKCHSCGESCTASFFCCIICQIDIHLECLSLPLTVKHSRHFHPLILRDSVLEDDLGQYYCDICENKRDPEHHVYYCEECNYTTHIDCVISQVDPPEEILSYLIHSSKKGESIQEKIEEPSKIIHLEEEEKSDVPIEGDHGGREEYNLEEAEEESNMYIHGDHGGWEEYRLEEAKEEKHREYILVLMLWKNIKNFQEEKAELTMKLDVVRSKLKKLMGPSTLLPSRWTAKKIKYFRHEHSLIFSMLSDAQRFDGRCKGCGDETHDRAYVCAEGCPFLLHKSCSELPETIEKHPLHPAHPLILSNYDQRITNCMICDGCQQVSGGQIYICERCRFTLDSKCAFLTDEEATELKGHEEVKTTKSHFSHDHPLTSYNMKEKFKTSCKGCKEAISDLAYACLECNFFLHRSCLDDMPQEVETLFHPQHRLLATSMYKLDNERCNACCKEIRGINFTCKYDCDFYLHASCAKYQTRAIKHQFHEHDLLYIGLESIGRCRKCHSCGDYCSAPFFCCVICNVDIHLECLPLPLTVKHNRHFHPLTLVNSITEDSGGYYCDFCETERNPKHHVYYCEECNCTAHIDCVVSQVEPSEEILSYLVPRKTMQLKESSESIIQHPSHMHSLTFSMLSYPKAFLPCRGCISYIHGPAYTCEECIFGLHKSCSEMPREIEKHPFHSAHSLYLQYFPEKPFICDGCQELCFGQKYFCESCRFSLDFKCACLTFEEAEALKGPQAKTTRSHFSHRHQLTWCNVKEELSISCLGCKEVISGAAYVCIPCGFKLHESCLNDMPKEVENLFHPQHHLLPQPFKEDESKNCNACNKRIKGIIFSCDDCSYYLHASCAKYQTRAIKHEFHQHDLLYFGERNIGRHPICDSCDRICESSFCCCISCDVDIHLECLPLPLTVKHNCHIHPLTLTDSIVEDVLGGYYCDLCKTARNPEHHVYHCKECNYTAHIDCVISQVEPPEEILSYLVPQTKKVESKQEDVEIGSKISDSKAEEGSNIEDLVPSEPKEEIENLQEEEEALVGRLELVQAKLKLEEFIDVMEVKGTKLVHLFKRESEG